jgi:hypothetical protein
MRRSVYDEPPVIEITFRDTTGTIIKRFNNCWEMAQYFKDFPDVGRRFGYVRRSEHVQSISIVDAMWNCIKEFGDRDFVNNLMGHDRGRIAAQDAMYIAKHAEGYYLTDFGKEFRARMSMIK